MTVLRNALVATALCPAFAVAMDPTAESAIIIDAASGKVLLQKNADTSRFPASTTKIMTGLLLVEHCKPDDIIVTPPEIETVKEASMHLRPGERIRAKDLLYGIMLRSANDGCYALAKHLAGDTASFARMMNERAAKIGCKHTHFNNPNGLNDPMHTTCARDLALIAQEAMKNDWFREVVKTRKTKINRGTNWQDLWMLNHNKQLRDPTCDGIKTGWTVPAGKCFVGSATRKGWQVITVVLKSKDWQGDTGHMFDWSFKNFEKRDEVLAGRTMGTATVAGGKANTLDVAPAVNAYNLVRAGSPASASKRELKLPASVAAPIKKGEKVGELIFTDGDGFEQHVPMLAQADVAATPVAVATKAGKDSSKMLIGAGLLFGAFWVRGRSRKRSYNGRY